MNNSQIRSEHPIVKLGRVIDILKRTLAPVPEAVPTEEQYQQWHERLRRQRTTYLQREAQQFVVNNKVYELALQDTPVDIKALNDDLDTLFAEGHPYKSTKAPTVKLKSDEPKQLVEYTLNHQENKVLNKIAAELMQARRDSIISHGRRQSERKMEATDHTEEPKSRRDKRK